MTGYIENSRMYSKICDRDCYLSTIGASSQSNLLGGCERPGKSKEYNKSEIYPEISDSESADHRAIGEYDQNNQSKRKRAAFTPAD